ncbi:MAG: cupredoxin domain-containing protein [Candidatus Zambryskibacteria bacterium]|nr:cupredoxin domain-containing protein [Candidatus Zambryskibacteria bacterium]
MNNTLVTVIIIIVLVLGGFFLFKSKGVAPTETEINNNMPVPTSGIGGTPVTEKVVEEVTEESAVNNVKEFSIDAASFSFTPSTITVNRGDTVKLTVKNTKGTHNLKIDEFNASTRTLNVGETQTISFVADKVGTFEYYCSIGNHRALGMVGSLIVR